MSLPEAQVQAAIERWRAAHPGIVKFWRNHMNPDFREGLHAYDAGEPLDPAWRGQKRRGWETARDNRIQAIRGVLHEVVRESRHPAEKAAAELLLNAAGAQLIAIYGRTGTIA